MPPGLLALAAALTTLALTLTPLPLEAQVPVRVPSAVAAAATRGPVRVIVRLATPEAAGDLRRADARSAQRAAVAGAQAAVLARLGGQAVRGVKRFTYVPGFAAEVDQAALLALAALPGVAAIEPDTPMRPIGVAPADPSAPVVVHSVPLIQAPLLWEAGIEGDGWTVAVLDSGVDPTHPFLRPRVVSEACYSSTVTSQGATSLCPGGASSSVATGSGWNCTAELDDIYDGCNHGTHVAGIAIGNDQAGSVYGVARKATLLSIQVFSHFENPTLCAPESSCILSYTSDQVRGLERVFELAGTLEGSRIAAINLSIGAGHYAGTCDTDYSSFKAAVDQLRALGIATVVASGNDGSATGLSAPACVSSVVSVGSSTKLDELSYFSNRSPQLSVLAPGSSIVSSVVGGAYVTYSGTSMAAPHVTGAWALLRERYSQASVHSILSALVATGLEIADVDSGLVYRRIRVWDAAAALGGPTGRPGAPASLQAVPSGNMVTISWRPPAGGGSVSAYEIVAGHSPGADDVGRFNVGTSLAVTASAAPGTYYLRVVALNASGAGAPSEEVSFAIEGGGPGPSLPAPPTGLTAQVSGSTVTLSWSAPAGGTAPTAYVIEAGSASGLADLATFVADTTPSVVVTGVPAGRYYVRVRARNGAGTGTPSTELVVVVP